MWWTDLLWGMWNGLSAWVVPIGQWEPHAVYNALRQGVWYDFGFLVGTGSPLLGMLGRRSRTGRRPRPGGS